MKQATHELFIKTHGRGLVNINHEIVSWAHGQGMTTGLLTVFIRHTSASLVIQENADPDVMTDLNAFLNRLVPDGDPQYRHSSEGDDDMPAHIRSALTQPQISIPMVNGLLALGTWQDIYLFEHRTAPHRRQVVLHLSGE
ncbi:MAG: secondary thiamine-phosphate synthase enzyme YjbQ [Nitrospinota bacterium]|jgi:secondary thiamine-phosphate synthase enzyme|nr:secondary thiamine-phosphate synthase enzyme YjbQ [Nitrospinota bacterium]